MRTLPVLSRRSLMASAGAAGGLTVLGVPFAPPADAHDPVDVAKGGFVVGNFGIAAQIIEGDALEAHIKINPPVMREWLRDFAVARLWAEDESGKRLPLRPIAVERLYPDHRARFEVATGVELSVHLFAPIGLDPELGFLPVIIADVELTADRAWRGRVGWTMTPHAASGTDHVATDSGEANGGLQGTAWIAVAMADGIRPTDGELSASELIALRRGSPQRLSFLAGHHSSEGRYAPHHSSVAALRDGVTARLPQVRQAQRDFVTALPVTGDPQVDCYARWYASAGILLTKGLASGDVLTMGYVELNQRDSYWSSGMHLLFWPALERRMIEEAIAAQTPEGRIPTTILPVIDRKDDIDISCYFALRVARYWRWHRDPTLLELSWPAVQRAIRWLASRDFGDVGVPRQRSFWADWKDVRGVNGRLYAPHFAMLWLAALKAARELAVAMNDAEAARDLDRRFERADAFVNKPWDEGGLRTGSFYAERWEDGRKPGPVLQDQLVGAAFGVIPADKLDAIYTAIAASETPWGVRETWPYRERFENSGNYGPGDYHNGGIWPYLNFVDVLGRYRSGRSGDAERIIYKVGHADLEAAGDWLPGEHLHGDSGRNLGFAVQSWDAALFQALYFGAFGIERTSDSEVELRVRIPRDRDFSTKLVLPAGVTGTLSSRGGRLRWRAEGRSDRLAVRLVDERA